MDKQIEVEYMGKISKEKFDELKIKFESEGKFKKLKKRLTFMYFRDYIPKDLEDIKDEEIDLRIRITNKEPELVIKKGLFTGSHSRKEISIKFKPEEISNYIDMLTALGWNIGVIYAVETYAFEYDNIEFALVNIDNYGYNFEAEILSNKENEEKAKNKIINKLAELGLKPFSEKELNTQCNDINNNKELQYDFSKQSIKEVKKDFKEFF